MKLSPQQYKELRVLFLSFHFFTVILQYNNGDIPKDFKRVFGRVRDTIRHYVRKYGDKICADLNHISKSIVKDHDIDMALAGVSVIALYYELMPKHIYSPMSYEQIREVQFAHLDEDYDRDKYTLDYCEEMVKKILE